ncbi:hypothetical protein QWY75_13775 [Pontixanthobacter aestiaquae]|uniref:YD repeat-containing protein n=1 Tax=Pontixanthobacter aestiaquae TaxID=1509367 RepID=A0A844ZF93_9SPHN|nr:hypothetical protein [Pontixanthobacter aestiaquae]MDN3647275.1 hypothetical protein [Pontixanthobacter aestiaquae]MXO84419.1 hypothetical protein [Pontixanthobacter aestiaquae]
MRSLNKADLKSKAYFLSTARSIMQNFGQNRTQYTRAGSRGYVRQSWVGNVIMCVRVALGGRALALLGALAVQGGQLSAQDGPPPPDAIPPSPAEQYAISQGGVDMRTGLYIYKKTDLTIGVVGGISFSRTNGSLQSAWKPMGQFSHNWHIFATYIPVKGGDASFSVRGARGTGFLSAGNSNSFTTRSPDYRARLQAVPTGPGALDRYLLYTAADGAKITFRPAGTYSDGPNRGHGRSGEGYYASKIEEPSGVTYTLSYDEPTASSYTFLRRVTSSTGYVLILEWVTNPVDRFVSKACVFNAAIETVPTANSCASASYKTSYSYGSNGYMTAATDSGNNVWTYSSTFSPAARATATQNWPNSNYTWTDSFFYPGEITPYLVNSNFANPFYRYTTSQTFTDGPTYSYDWYITEHNEIEMEVAGGVVTDADGETVSVRYQEMTRPGYQYGDSYMISPNPKKIVDELGQELNADYCTLIGAGGQPGYPYVTGCAAVSAKYWKRPDGSQSDYTYDLYGNILTVVDKPRLGTNDPNITRRFTYDCSTEVNCSKPTTLTDGKGRVTNAVYSSLHGGVLKRTLPADASGVRPETRYTYTQMSPWKKSGSGYMISTSPVWVLTSEEYCKTSAADSNGNCAAGASDEVVTTYEYQQGSASKGSNLLLLGTAVTADGQTLRTCYTYDDRGRKISETQPLGVSGVCP